VFLNLDKEHTVTTVGLAVYPKEDKKNLEQAYSEEFSGTRQKRFPYNPTLVKNSVTPIIIGWVGELYTNVTTINSYMYSMLYAKPNPDVLAWQTPNNLETYRLLLGGKFHFIKTFFLYDESQKELLP
jgi:hypothetical protein